MCTMKVDKFIPYIEHNKMYIIMSLTNIQIGYIGFRHQREKETDVLVWTPQKPLSDLEEEGPSEWNWRRNNWVTITKTGADPGFPIGGFYLFQCARKFWSHAHFVETTPILCVFASSQSQFTAATDLWISNLAKVSESTFEHDSTS